MEPAPDAGHLRDEAVDTLGCHSFPRDLQQLQHAFHTEASALQLRSCSLPGVSSDVQSNFNPDSPYQQQQLLLLAAEAGQATSPNPLPTPHHHHRPSSDTIRHASPPPIDADDFYNNYRALDASAGPDLLPMAATSSSRPSLRSNGDGTTTKKPAVSVQHNQPRANLRSVSSPLENRSSAHSSARIPTGKPSVKDLKKRFDQNAAVGVPTIPPPPARAPSERLKPTKLRIRSPVNSLSRFPSRHDTTFEHGSRGSSDAVDTANSFQPPRQSNFVADYQLSGSTQSFASRVGKPRNSTYRGLAPHRPITSTQKKATTLPLPISPASRHPEARDLLFGEILPDQHERNAESLGHGIDELRLRRTSEPCVQFASSLRRNLYSPEGKGSFPPSRPAGAVTAGPAPRRQPHARAHSDDGSSSASSRAARHPTSKFSTRSSKLPVFVRKLSTPSNSPSSSSTRSSSPPTLKRFQANGRRYRTSPGPSRVKTPTQARKFTAPNNSNATLQALIAVPPSKLSPTLRSSRPRQPVSIASTSSSRMKETDRARTGRTGGSSNARRKLSIGPIDFERRREHIRLAYTKSIQESEALEARHKADAENARRELKTLPFPRDTSEPSAASNDSPGEAQSSASAIQLPAARSSKDNETQKFVLDTDNAQKQTAAPTVALSPTEVDPSPPLTIATESDAIEAGQDSPTLGLPGSFPDRTLPTFGDPRPLSAISATSDTTEFDTEPQINPPIQALSPVGDNPVDVVDPATPRKRPRAEYQYPFHEETGSPIRGSPKASHHNLQKIELDEATSVPGSLINDVENFEPQGLGINAFQTQYAATASISASESSVTSDINHDQGTIPFPRLGSLSESDCQSELDQDPLPVNHRQGQQHHNAATDPCTKATDDGEDQESGVQSREYYEDASRFYRTSTTCASAHGGTYDDAHYSGRGQERQEHQQCDASSTSDFLVPPCGFHDEKLNRQSTWTDFSVDSGDQSVMPSSRESPAFGHVTIFHPRTEPSINGLRAKTQDPCESEPPRPPSTHHKPMRLPEVDTGNGFSIPCFSPDPNDSVRHVQSPSTNLESPLLSPPIFDSEIDSRASSAYYEQAQYDESTLLNSERGSGEYMSRADTSQSLDSASFAVTEQYATTQTPVDSDSKSLVQNGEELSEKERHRLIQRRNVIKELVDTEAVFVRDMNIVEEIYKGTAEACPKLDSKTVKLIFRNSDEIIAFHTVFLSEIKDSVADVYVPKGGRMGPQDDSSISTPSSATSDEPNDSKDRCTTLGPVFKENIEQMKLAHEGFLRASDQAAKRLIQIQQDPTVQLWLTECNEVAKDLTAAWDLDSLLIKPMQRITKYPNLIASLLQHTPQDHPDREALKEAKSILETAIIDINKTKKNFELVGQIVGRKRKESDVRAGFARAFGKRVDKLQASNNNNRLAEDADYAKLNEKFGDDYLRLQVVLRDVEFYTRQVSAYVHEFLQYMSSIELVMRLQPGNYPELESKWVQFNISVRDLEKVALEEHLCQVRKLVIEPFEQVIKAYGNPSLAMKKREKRRLDFERSEQLRKGGKSPDPKLKELVEQYDALNDTLKKELPQLSTLTEKIGNICLGNFVNIQAKWYSIWKDKMKVVLTTCSDAPEIEEVVTSFERDFPYASNQLANIGVLSPATWGRTSISTSTSVDESSSSSLRMRPRPSDPEVRRRSRGQSVNGNAPPTLPAPDFGARHSGSFTMSPTSQSAPLFANGSVPSPHQYYYRDYYAGIAPSQGGLASPRSPEFPSSFRSAAGAGSAGSAGFVSTRPSTGRSHESGMPRQSSESGVQSHRDPNTAYHSNAATPETQRDNHRFSNMFRSAMPMSDGLDEGGSQQESRGSSRDRSQTSDGYNVLWLAASLFEFNIATTKHEAGYPYLTYQTGELFDVIAEKGELWLAKNQDDAEEQVGWIWSKHFAKLAES
ncbi:hypothetical protein E4U42_003573 [Claviceps africana]|uniref:DH domain-containing protein n=1 Tax=Claviceps africana TaxID=83212 RepID=A0A8K0J748_9HYPO|nr:hypothetical protein E4U42_003573 [Claviceps africana]